MIIVSGLRRSGTSMMMLCLKEAGFKIIGKSMADDGNPTGYWETAAASRGTRAPFEGVIKVLAEGLPYCEYFDKFVVMRREYEGILGSMVKRKMVVSREVGMGIIVHQERKMMDFLEGKNFILVDYEKAVKNPRGEMKRVCEFLGEGDYLKAAKVIK